MSIIASLARATLLEAVRNRLLWLAVVMVVIAFGLAQFLNQVAITESREIQTALLAAPMRVAGVFIRAVFVITSMVRELSDKVTELLLSLPAPRSAYFFGKLSGYALVATILALLSALPLVPFANSQGLAFWTVSLVCELLIVAAMSLFCVLSFAQVVPAFAAVAGFYLLSRSMAAMQIIASAPRQDADDLAAGGGTGREHSGLRRGPDRALSRADLFRCAFRLASQELLRTMSQRPIAAV